MVENIIQNKTKNKQKTATAKRAAKKLKIG